MKVFISWSSARSRKMAELIKQFLEDTLQATDPWISTSIEKGKRWNKSVNDNLKNTNFGIICLTKENLESKWVHFEAGALAKLEESCLYTLLFNLKHNDVKQPLAQFQHTLFSKQDFKKLIQSINSNVGNHG